MDLLKKYSDHEIVYLDQMFEQKNDARAKKEIQFLRNLDFEEFDLNRFKKSLKQNNFKKIIYKSALYSNMNSLINLKPSRVIKGKAFKYNIFTWSIMLIIIFNITFRKRMSCIILTIQFKWMIVSNRHLDHY